MAQQEWVILEWKTDGHGHRIKINKRRYYQSEVEMLKMLKAYKSDYYLGQYIDIDIEVRDVMPWVNKNAKYL